MQKRSCNNRPWWERIAESRLGELLVGVGVRHVCRVRSGGGFSLVPPHHSQHIPFKRSDPLKDDHNLTLELTWAEGSSLTVRFDIGGLASSNGAPGRSTVGNAHVQRAVDKLKGIGIHELGCFIGIVFGIGAGRLPCANGSQ